MRNKASHSGKQKLINIFYLSALGTVDCIVIVAILDTLFPALFLAVYVNVKIHPTYEVGMVDVTDHFIVLAIHVPPAPQLALLVV